MFIDHILQQIYPQLAHNAIRSILVTIDYPVYKARITKMHTLGRI